MNTSIVIAYIADLLIGDPENRPHPVRYIGKAIDRQERYLRGKIKNNILAGAILFTSTVLATYYIAIILGGIAHNVHPLFGFIINVLFIYWSLSVKSLGDEATALYDALRKGDMEIAKKRLARIVARDTEKMDEKDIARAGLETVSENLVDGIISPLFFAALGGGPLAMAYRAINTCDSMLGYRNEKYEEFGKVSALGDDAANFIPARLSIVFITAASFIMGLDYRNSWKVALRDRLKHPSPNAAHPEAAFAGALGVQLGGVAFYDGVEREKPILGKGYEVPGPAHLPEGVRLMRVTSLLACILFASV